jgi:chromate transporter
LGIETHRPPNVQSTIPNSVAHKPPGLFDLALAFGRVGLLSFGGGSASQLFLRRELVWKHGWITEDEYNRMWQLSKLTIGIQQIGQVILYGRKLAGWRGIAIGVAGFLVPSVALTILVSIALVAVIGNRYVEDALRLVIPLTGGMTMAIAFQMWNPQLPSSTRKWLHLAAQAVMVLICSLLVGVLHVPVPLVMAAALLLGAALPV